jgi:hypothetical protein
MMQLLIKYGNIVLTTTTGLRVRYHLYLLLLVRQVRSGRLHSEFVRLLFLQPHRETDRFFAASGVQSAQSTSGQFHFRRAAFSQELKGKVGLALAKATVTLANFSFVNLVFIFRCSSSPTNPVCSRRVNLLVCSLPLHRHSYIGFIFSFRFIDS